jgi:hypothetical protein
MRKVHSLLDNFLDATASFQKKIFLTTSNERFLPAQQIIGGSVAGHEAGRHTDLHQLVPTMKK